MFDAVPIWPLRLSGDDGLAGDGLVGIASQFGAYTVVDVYVDAEAGPAVVRLSLDVKLQAEILIAGSVPSSTTKSCTGAVFDEEVVGLKMYLI